MKSTILYCHRDVNVEPLIESWCDVDGAEIFTFEDPIKFKDIKDLKSLEDDTKHAIIFISSNTPDKLTEILKITDNYASEYYAAFVLSETGEDESLEDFLNSAVEELDDESPWIDEDLMESGHSNFVAITVPDSCSNHVSNLINVMENKKSLNDLDSSEPDEKEMVEDSVKEETQEKIEDEMPEDEEDCKEEEKKEPVEAVKEEKKSSKKTKKNKKVEETLASNIAKEAEKRINNVKETDEKIKETPDTKACLNLYDDANKLPIEVIEFAKATYNLLQLIGK